MFEKASRLKIRFNTPQGKISVEDLWDLPLTSNTNKANLDDIARGLSREIKNNDTEESFVLKTTPANSATKTAFEIVKHVISVRLAENEAADTRRATNAKKQQIMALIDQKKNEKLTAKSEEELQALLESM